jgi:hypothetical protein
MSRALAPDLVIANVEENEVRPSDHVDSNDDLLKAWQQQDERGGAARGVGRSPKPDGTPR